MSLMDYHIVPNLTQQPKKVKSRRSHSDLHDWHFEATLFGAGMLILLLPLVASLLPSRNPEQVLGAHTQRVISQRVYDSEVGYYQPGASIENQDIFSSIINSIFSIFR